MFSSTFDATLGVFDKSDVLAWPKVSVPLDIVNCEERKSVHAQAALYDAESRLAAEWALALAARSTLRALCVVTVD